MTLALLLLLVAGTVLILKPAMLLLRLGHSRSCMRVLILIVGLLYKEHALPGRWAWYMRNPRMVVGAIP